jgi:hypothetical protein
MILHIKSRGLALKSVSGLKFIRLGSSLVGFERD